MATWATPTPLNHPWFMPQTSKRKQAPNAPEREPSPPPKRPRLHALEHHLAHLSLNHSPIQVQPSPSSLDFLHVAPSQVREAHPGQSYPMISEIPLLEEMDTLPIENSVIFPQFIESPTVPEIKMRTSSWYEPEPDRIVITDLDGSSDEETDTHTPPVEISAALLDRIKSQPFDSHPVLPAHCQTLVLFRPLLHPVGAQLDSQRNQTKEEDRMDIG